MYYKQCIQDFIDHKYLNAKVPVVNGQWDQPYCAILDNGRVFNQVFEEDYLI
ncbi:MAG: hypothetical protein J0G32_08395 [Alphaproteobacteria bacterium]|nr:hypothetical protein [Alphaproteobacteria bacterium]